MFSNEILDTFYNGILQSIENTVMSYAQENPYTNSITNYLAPNSIFKDVDELIGFKDETTDKIIFKYGRKYGENEPELTNYSQLVFNPNTGKPEAVKISNNEKVGLGELSGSGKELFSEESELMGSLAVFTGGVFPGHIGDVRKYKPYMETREHIKRDAMGLAFDYCREKATELQGNPANGKKWYVAKVPNMSKPLDAFKPSKYDTGLINKFWGAGTAYYLLEPLFHLPKKAIMSFSIREKATSEGGKSPLQRGAGESQGTAVLDPIIDMQANMAKKIQRAAGGAIAPAYPLLFVTRPFLEILENYITEPVYGAVDDIFSAVEGLFNPLPPQPKKAQGRIPAEGLIE